MSKFKLPTVTKTEDIALFRIFEIRYITVYRQNVICMDSLFLLVVLNFKAWLALSHSQTTWLTKTDQINNGWVSSLFSSKISVHFIVHLCKEHDFSFFLRSEIYPSPTNYNTRRITSESSYPASLTSVHVTALDGLVNANSLFSRYLRGPLFNYPRQTKPRQPHLLRRWYRRGQEKSS